MDYANSYTNFSHSDTYQYAVNHASRETKEFYLRAGMAGSLPHFLKYLNYYLLLNDIATYIPRLDRITRSTGLDYYLSVLTRMTNIQEDYTQYNCPLLYSNTPISSFILTETLLFLLVIKFTTLLFSFTLEIIPTKVLS